MRVQNVVIAVLLLALAGCADPYDQGMQAYEQGHWQEAIEHFGKVRKLSGQYTESLTMISRAHFQLGKEAYERGEWLVALESMQGVGRSDENYPLAREMIDGSHFQLGRAAYRQQHWSEAVGRLGIVREDFVHYDEAQSLFVKARAELEEDEVVE